jgi:hypothetical protein
VSSGQLETAPLLASGCHHRARKDLMQDNRIKDRCVMMRQICSVVRYRGCSRKGLDRLAMI